MNGTVSANAYTTVFQSHVGATSGSASFTWLLAPGDVQRSGSYEVTLRWKFEAVFP